MTQAYQTCKQVLMKEVLHAAYWIFYWDLLVNDSTHFLIMKIMFGIVTLNVSGQRRTEAIVPMLCVK